MAERGQLDGKIRAVVDQQRRLSALATRQKRQALKQMNILLVL